LIDCNGDRASSSGNVEATADSGLVSYVSSAGVVDIYDYTLPSTAGPHSVVFTWGNSFDPFLCSKKIAFNCLDVTGHGFPTLGLPRIAPGADCYGLINTSAPTHADIRIVTNLNDSGTGSLRAQLGANRTIVFDVAGWITTASELFVGYASLTILGQTAPGMGVGLRCGTGAHNLLNAGNANEVRIEHMRLAPGDSGPDGNVDPFRIENSNANAAFKLLFKHCHLYWGRDQLGSIYYSSRDVVLDRCILGPTLDSMNSRGLIVGGGGAGTYCDRVAVTRSLITRCNQRLPVFQGDGNYTLSGSVVAANESEGTTLQCPSNIQQTNIFDVRYLNNLHGLSRGEIMIWLNGGTGFEIYLDNCSSDNGEVNRDLVHAINIPGFATYQQYDVSDPQGYYRSSQVGVPHNVPRISDPMTILPLVGPTPNRRDAQSLRMVNSINSGNQGSDVSVAAAGGYPGLGNGPSRMDITRADLTTAQWRLDCGMPDSDDARTLLDARGVPYIEHFFHKLCLDS